MDIHCSKADGRAVQNRLAVDVRGGAVKKFYFAEVINEWPLNGRIIETRVSIRSFDLRIVCINLRLNLIYLRLIIYRFQIHLLLLVYELCFFFVFVLDSVIFENIF